MDAELRERVLAVLYGPYGPSNRQEQTADALAPFFAEVEAAALESEERNPWKRAVVELAVVNGTYRTVATPKEMLNEAVAFDVMAALDPAVSQAARDLEAAARADERAEDALRAAYMRGYAEGAEDAFCADEMPHKDTMTEGWVIARADLLAAAIRAQKEPTT